MFAGAARPRSETREARDARPRPRRVPGGSDSAAL